MTEISAQKLIFVASVTMSAIAALIISRRLLNSGSAIADDSLHDTQPLAETSLLELQVVDLTSFITHSNKGDGTCNDECKAVAKALCDYGIVIIRDNRVSVTDNDAFIDMMER